MIDQMDRGAANGLSIKGYNRTGPGENGNVANIAMRAPNEMKNIIRQRREMKRPLGNNNSNNTPAGMAMGKLKPVIQNVKAVIPGSLLALISKSKEINPKKSRSKA